MTAALCATCARPMADHAVICSSCAYELTVALRAVPDLLDDLEVTLTRQSRLGQRGGRRGGDNGLPYDQRASDRVHELRAVLVGWVRVLMEGQPEPPIGPACESCSHGSCASVRHYYRRWGWPAESTTAVAEWLRDRVPDIRHHEAGPDAHAEIIRAVRAAQKAVDAPQRRTYAGPCDQCGTDLYGRLGAVTVSCRDCGARYDTVARREWLLDAAEDTLAHAALAARALTSLGRPITAAMIRGYAHRRRLTPHGTDRFGHPLYRIGDLLDLIATDERIPA